MKKIVGIVVATAALSTVMMGATPAQAAQFVPDRYECTHNEYSRVERGMSLDRVARIIGTRGKIDYQYSGYVSRKFGGKKVGSYSDPVTWSAECHLTFQNGRVDSKDGWYSRI